MKHTLLVVSCLSLGLGAGAAGCAGSHSSSSTSFHAGAVDSRNDSGFARDDSVAQPKLKGAAVGNYNKGYVDGVNASAFFNKGQPLTDQQVDRLIEIGRRQGDPTGLLALPGYPDGYRTGAKHARNPYEKQMTGEQVAQVRKAQGLPPAPPQVSQPAPKREDAQASARADRKAERKSKRGAKESAEASAR
jgi:hypothetical protein